MVSSVATNGGSALSYSYDSQGQLTQDSLGSYTYNPNGGVTSLFATDPMTYNAGSQVVTSGKGTKVVTYAYNTEGERTSAKPKSGSATSFAYNQADELVGFAKGTTAANYTYNGDGSRISKTVGATTTPFTWDTEATVPLLLFDGATSYLYGPGGLPLEQINGATLDYFHHDQLGSTTMLTSATGTKLSTFVYDSYGILKSHTGATTAALLYGGQYMDTESGLYYLQARYYDPATAQFVSVDPLVSQTQQPYEYAGNDPTDASDPLGLFDLNPLAHLRGLAQIGITVAGVAGAVACGASVVCAVAVGAAASAYIYYVGGNATLSGVLEYAALGGVLGAVGTVGQRRRRGIGSDRRPHFRSNWYSGLVRGCQFPPIRHVEFGVPAGGKRHHKLLAKRHWRDSSSRLI